MPAFFFFILESLIQLFVFHGLSCVSSRVVSFNGSSWIVFVKLFSVIYFWWIFYSIPIIFILKSFKQSPHTENIYRLHFGIYCCFFLFYPVWRINIWSPTFKIDLATSIKQQLNWIENRITAPHWCF